MQSVRAGAGGSSQSSRAASVSSVSSLGSPVAGDGSPYALFTLRPEPKTLARFSTGGALFVLSNASCCICLTTAAWAAPQRPLAARRWYQPASTTAQAHNALLQ